MQPKSSRRGLAAAILTGALLLAPAAQAGAFSSAAFLDLVLTSTLPDDVELTYTNGTTFADDFASNPPWSFYDADALFTDEPALGAYGTILAVQGDALGVRGSPFGEVRSQRLTEGTIEIVNNSNDPVTLNFEYAFAIIAEVFAQVTGPSAANAFARVELFWDQDFIIDEVVAAALDGLTIEDRSANNTFTLTVPGGQTRTLSFYVDAGGDATHVPVPASLPLVAAGLLLAGLIRRRAAA